MEAEVKEEVVKVVRARRVRSIQGIRQPDMLTSLLNSPVDAIGVLASLLIFVRNQGLAHGKISGSQSLTNEIQASPHHQ